MIKTTQCGFYDLNISLLCFSSATLKQTLTRLHDFGYRTIAINQTIEADGNEPKKKKKKGEPRESVDCLPPPYDLKELKNAVTELGFSNFTILNRLTIVFSLVENIQKYVKSSNFKKYDVVAVDPRTTSALTFTCNTLEADIITFDAQTKLDYKFNRRVYFQLVQKGYHFELLYSPAIEDSTKRKNTIFFSHLLYTLGKSRNVIFSSGAENPMLLRSPYDITSLGFLFGLNELQAKSAVLSLPRNVTVNALGRRQGKAVMVIENMVETVETIMLDSEGSGEEDMDTDEPAQKKTKHAVNTVVME